MSDCCSANHSCDTNNSETINTAKSLCPICNKSGQKVRVETVQGLLKDKFESTVQNTPYYLCMNPACEVAYFNLESGQAYQQKDLKTPIWFKESANPVIACYCMNVTKDAVVETVLNRGASTLKEIQAMTAANTGKDCLAKNPAGKCCGANIREMIKETLVLKNNRKK